MQYKFNPWQKKFIIKIRNNDHILFRYENANKKEKKKIKNQRLIKRLKKKLRINQLKKFPLKKLKKQN